MPDMRVGSFVVPNLAKGKDQPVPLVVHMDGQGGVTAVVEVMGMVGIGIARCRPEDYYNEEIGVNIATARAIKDICSAIEKIWVDRTHTKEEVAARRASKKLLKI